MSSGRLSACRLSIDDSTPADRLQQVQALCSGGLRIQPATHVRLDEDREPVANPREVRALARSERRQVLVCVGRLRARQSAGEVLQALGVHVGGDRPQAHLQLARPQRSHDMAEVALRLAHVVRLGEQLPRERLVGDLALASRGEGVVDAAARRRPLHIPAARALRGAAQRGPHVLIPLGIERDHAHTALDRGRGEQRLRDRLARAGRPHDQHVGRSPGSERDRHGHARDRRVPRPGGHQTPAARSRPACTRAGGAHRAGVFASSPPARGRRRRGGRAGGPGTRSAQL